MRGLFLWFKKLWPFSLLFPREPILIFDRPTPTPGVSQREKNIRTARTKITDAMLIAFFRAIPEEGMIPICVGIIQGSLEQDANLDEIFCYGDGDEFGFSLSVTPKGENQFTIEFGCQAGELMGDGGEWDVTFDAQGGVKTISGGASWIS